jgi:hypothetical protein
MQNGTVASDWNQKNGQGNLSYHGKDVTNIHNLIIETFIWFFQVPMNGPYRVNETRQANQQKRRSIQRLVASHGAMQAVQPAMKEPGKLKG